MDGSYPWHPGLPERPVKRTFPWLVLLGVLFGLGIGVGGVHLPLSYALYPNVAIIPTWPGIPKRKNTPSWRTW